MRIFQRSFARPGRLVWAAALLALLGMGGSIAWAISVTPVIVDLQTQGRRTSEVITLVNSNDAPVTLEMRTQTASYANDGVNGTGTASDDIIAFPPQVIIPPGGSQAIRVQYVGDPDIAQGRHYLLTIAQLPVALPDTGQNTVQILYNFQAVIGVNPTGVQPNIAVQSSEVSTTGDGQPRLVLTLTNDSGAYGYLSSGSLRVIQTDDAGQEVFSKTWSGEEIVQEIGYGLVGAGQTRRIETPIVLPTAGGRLEARFTPARR